MNEIENKIENTESYLIDKDDYMPINLLPIRNNNNTKKPRVDLNKKIEKNKHDNFENLSNLEKIVLLNEHNHHIKDFLFDIQKNKRNSMVKLRKNSSKENNDIKSIFFIILNK